MKSLQLFPTLFDCNLPTQPKVESTLRLSTDSDPARGRALPQEHDLYDLVEESKFIQYPTHQGLLAPPQETDVLPEAEPQAATDRAKQTTEEASRKTSSSTLPQVGFYLGPDKEVGLGSIQEKHTEDEEAGLVILHQ